MSRITNFIRSIIEFMKRKTGIGKPAQGEHPGATYIDNGMEVVASCGTTVGLADHVENERLQLQGQHSIPGKWILRVDKRVHLSKNAEEVHSSFHLSP